MREFLIPVGMMGQNYNIADQSSFDLAVKLLSQSLFDKGATLYCSDNVITWNRNFSFLREPFFGNMLDDPAVNTVEKSIVWRTYILLYFAEIASRAEGSYLELGCHTGFTASKVIEKVDFEALGKQYYLYDLFAWSEGDVHSHMHGHENTRMFEDVVARFAPHPFVRVIKGSVPESFAEGFPDKIAFAHIDMNNPIPEAGALELVLPRLSSGGAIIFDDYGWWGYSDQKMAIDPVVAKHGLKILELPTGQALLLKP